MKGTRLKKSIGLLCLVLILLMAMPIAPRATHITLANLGNAVKNDRVTIDGKDWIVVKTQTVGTAPNAVKCVYLIMVGHFLGNAPFGNNQNYDSSTLRANMKWLLDNNYLPTIHAIAVKPNLNPPHNNMATLTSPIAAGGTTVVMAGSTTQDILFAPSNGDMREWINGNTTSTNTAIPSNHPLHSGSGISFSPRFYGRTAVSDGVSVTGVNRIADQLDYGILASSAMYAYEVPCVWVNAGAVNREVKVHYVDTAGNPIPPGGPTSKTYNVTIGNTFTLTSSDVPTIPGYTYKEWKKGASGTPTTAPFPNPTLSAKEVIDGTDIYLVYQQDFTITYDSNDAANGTWSHSAGFGSGTQQVTVRPLSDTGFTPQPGVKFLGWNTQANGQGTAYAPGASMPVSGNVTLYAQWGPDIVNLTIAKEVAGDYADRTKEFSFVVFFGRFNIHGEVHILKHDQSATFEVVTGSEVKIVELLPDGYTVSYTDSLFPGVVNDDEDDTGWLVMTAGRTITFTNTRDVSPPTGIGLGDLGALLLLPLLLIAAIPVYLAARKMYRRRRPEDA